MLSTLGILIEVDMPAFKSASTESNKNLVCIAEQQVWSKIFEDVIKS